MAALAAAPQGSDSVHARAETLLSDGELRQARALLERHLASHGSDTRALLLLGRVYLDWPVVGRWQALRLFRHAASLAPDDPAPWYWKIKVGRYLGSADGEALMKSGIFGVFARHADYRDVWAFWEEIYHSPSVLLRAAAVLARHAGHPIADLRRAQLLTEAGEYDAAETLAAALISGGRTDGGVWAIRAQAALEAGDTTGGLAFYQQALHRAATDSLQLLWRQVAPIAWPDEDSSYARTAPADREEFFRAFWARREPDLLTGPNERVAEHFERLRHARRHYHLRHPQSRFHYSPERRALMSSESGRVLEALLDFGIIAGIVPGRSRFENEIQAAGVGVDIRDVPEPDSLTRYRRYGFDGRGLIYLRYGEPQRRMVDHQAEVEAWDYAVGSSLARLVFARVSSESGGDMVFYPTSRGELHNVAVMLERDATSVAANQDVLAWAAFFRGALEGEQSVYVGVMADTSAAALWDDEWIEVGRQVGTAPHVFTLARGAYTLGVDTRHNEKRGRLRATIDVPTFWRGTLALSSLLIGVPVDDSVFGRDEVARAMPGDGRLPRDTSLALYAEIYGLSTDRSGRSLYEVEYRFEPVGGGRAVTLSFDRSTLGVAVVPERILVQPGRIPAGRFRAHLTVRDKVRRRIAQSTHVTVELR